MFEDKKYYGSSNCANKNIEEKVKYIISSNGLGLYGREDKEILDRLIELNKMDLVLKSTCSSITDFLVANYFKEIIDYIILENTVPWSIIHNKKVLDKLVELKRMDLALQFDNSLIDEKFIDDNINEIINFIILENTVPWSITHNKKVLDKLVELKGIDFILDDDRFYFDDNILVANYFKEIIDYIILNDRVPDVFKNNEKVANKLVELKRIDLVLYYPSYFTVDFLVANYFNEIMDYVILKNTVPWSITHNKKVLDKLVKLKRWDLVLKFDDSLITETFIDNNIDEIINNTVLSSVAKNRKIFNKIVELKRMDLALEFDNSLIDEIFIDNNIDKIIEYINLKKDVPFSLINNKKMLEKLVYLKRIDLALRFDDSLIDEIFIDNNFNEIIEYIILRGIVPSKLKCNKKIFNKIVELKRIDLALEFDNSLITETFIDNNIDEIIEYINILLSKITPFIVGKNKKIFNKIVELKRIDLALRFDDSLITETFIDNNFNEIIEYITLRGIVPSKLKCNKKIFNKIVELKRMDLALEFDNSLITETFIENNFNEIIEYIILENIVSSRIRKNKKIFNKTVELKRIDLALEFDNSLIDEIFIDNNINKIMEYINLNKAVPFSLINNKKMLEKLVELKRMDFIYDYRFLFDDEILEKYDIGKKTFNYKSLKKTK